MTRNEVAMLFLAIHEHYSQFDMSDRNLDRYYAKLEDFPLTLAMENLNEYVLTHRYRKEPEIADLRGGMGGRKELEQSRREAQQFLEQLDQFGKQAVLPPEKVRDEIHALRQQFFKHTEL